MDETSEEMANFSLGIDLLACKPASNEQRKRANENEQRKRKRATKTRNENEAE